MCSSSQTHGLKQICNDLLKKMCHSLRGLLDLGVLGTNLSFEVVLPFRRLQSFEASAAVGRHWHAERPMDSGEQLGGQGHRVRPQAGGFTSTHDEIGTGAWSTQRDRDEDAAVPRERHGSALIITFVLHRLIRPTGHCLHHCFQMMSTHLLLLSFVL